MSRTDGATGPGGGDTTSLPPGPARPGAGARRPVVRGPAVLVAAALALAGCSAEEPVATEVPVAGDLRTHDPALVAGVDGEPWYVFSTGDRAVDDGAIQVRTSPDGREWTAIEPVWDEAPAWVADVVPDVENFWAPEVYAHDGTYYLYYSASTFGSNRSAIGLMTATTLDPADPAHGWTDRGEVIRSEPGRDDWNAIDPGIVEDADGVPWMAFGSFWGGIQMVRLEWPSGLLADPDAEPVAIASRGVPPNAIEAPYLVRRDGWYYLFVSKDLCCRGAGSTYNIVVGRSRDVTGPFVDADGRSMLEDGGVQVLSSLGPMVGPGGQSVSAGHLAFHYYDADAGGDFRLAIRELAWEDGWPVAVTERLEG